MGVDRLATCLPAAESRLTHRLVLIDVVVKTLKGERVIESC